MQAGRLPTIVFDQRAYMRDLDIALAALMREAARAWIRGILTKVPVWSGQSRGSLRPIGRFVNEQVPISVSRTAPGDRTSKGERQQSFSFTGRNGHHTMSFTTEVPHYLLNEYYQSSLPLLNPTPWHSFTVGKAMWASHIYQNVPLVLPNISNYFKVI
jgi:hypothetical protein